MTISTLNHLYEAFQSVHRPKDKTRIKTVARHVFEQLFAMGTDLLPTEIELLKNGNKILAVKQYKARLGLLLKAAIDNIKEQGYWQ